MVRKTKSGKVLSRHKATRKWCKNYQDNNGKRKTEYFGQACNENDTRAYEAALTEYLEWSKQREALVAAAGLIKLYDAVLAGQLPVSSLGSTPWARDRVAELKFKGLLREDGYVDGSIADPDDRDANNPDDWQDEHDTTWAADDPAEAKRMQIEAEKQQRAFVAQQRLKALKAHPKVNGSKSIAEHMDAWLAEAKLTVDAGELTDKGYKGKKDGIETMRRFVAGQSFGKPVEVEQLLTDYRAHLLKLVALRRRLEAEAEGRKVTGRGKSPDKFGYAPGTFNDKVKFGGQFIKWCWKRSALKEQPRNYEDFVAKLHTEKQGEPLTVDGIQKIWAVANDRQRCFMALGLNCGFKNGDVIDLEGKHIQGARLLGIRKKTEKLRVPMNYALWPLTQRLIEAERNNTGDDAPVFVNTKGNRITTGTFSALFRKLADRAGVDATFEQLRDTSTDLVKQALHAGDHDSNLLDRFLAHKNNKMSQHYTTDDPRFIQSPALDKIVLDLQAKYGLE